jgi:pimeloyl-ACP methyl ester carboxylesterase
VQIGAVDRDRDPGRDPGRDRDLEAAQAAWLARAAPGARVRRIAWSGGSTQVLEQGEAAHPPVVLLHGGLGDAFQWAPLLPLLPHLAPARVLAIDRPGHGLADPFDYRAGVDLLAHARTFLRETFDALGLDRPDLVASSMGGRWALDLALHHPERVRRLVLVGAPLGVSRGVPFMLRAGSLPVLRRIARFLMARPTPDSVRSFFKLLVADPTRLDPAFVAAAVASQRRNVGTWLGLLDLAVGPGGIHRHLLMADRWKDLRVPATLVWGERDAFTSIEVGAAIAAAHPALRLVRVPDAGHAPWLDDPRRVAEAIAAALTAEA